MQDGKHMHCRGTTGIIPKGVTIDYKSSCFLASSRNSSETDVFWSKLAVVAAPILSNHLTRHTFRHGWNERLLLLDGEPASGAADGEQSTQRVGDARALGCRNFVIAYPDPIPLDRPPSPAIVRSSSPPFMDCHMLSTAS